MKAVLLVAVVAALLAPGAALAGRQHPTQSELESEIMCPVCGTTLDQSDSAVAQDMKMFIAHRIAAGDTKSQIEDALVAQFGEAVLAAPPKHGFNLIAWLLPLIGLLVAAPIVGWAAWRWSRARDAGPPAPPSGLDPDTERRIDRELARYETS
jgi:cytochrome c-type biogenesis protein CcmH/NrfF